MAKLSGMERRYGLNIGWNDGRDYQLEASKGVLRLTRPDFKTNTIAVTELDALAVPDVVDMRQFRGPARDQSNIGSCGGFGSTNAIRTLLNSIDYKWKFTGSALFAYWNTRFLQGTVDSDSGVDIRTLLQAINKWGICPEDSSPHWSWPYDTKKYKEKPPEDCFKDAVLHKAIEYYWVKQDRESIKTALAHGFTLILGTQVHESFESEEVAHTGTVPMPGSWLTDPVLGGHCTSADGYDNATDRVMCQNSWGSKWGDKGGFTFPIDYLVSKKQTSDIVALQKVGA